MMPDDGSGRAAKLLDDLRNRKIFGAKRGR